MAESGTGPNPDQLARGTDPRNRMRVGTKMSRIRNTDYWSTYRYLIFFSLFYFLWYKKVDILHVLCFIGRICTTVFWDHSGIPDHMDQTPFPSIWDWIENQDLDSYISPEIWIYNVWNTVGPRFLSRPA